jgi:hypothetical protein
VKKLGGGDSANIQISSRSQAKGLVEGLKQELNKVSADQLTQARECMKPYIDRVLNYILKSQPPLEQYGKIKIHGTRANSRAGNQCQLVFSIEFSDQTVRPIGYAYQVDRIRLGQTNWTIRGEIKCPSAYCQTQPASPQTGQINLKNGGTYTVDWGFNQFLWSQCWFNLREDTPN